METLLVTYSVKANEHDVTTSTETADKPYSTYVGTYSYRNSLEHVSDVLSLLELEFISKIRKTISQGELMVKCFNQEKSQIMTVFTSPIDALAEIQIYQVQKPQNFTFSSGGATFSAGSVGAQGIFTSPISINVPPAVPLDQKYINLKFTLSDQLVSSQWRAMGHLLAVPQGVLFDFGSAFDLFTWMEGKGILSADNISLLYSIFQNPTVGMNRLTTFLDEYSGINRSNIRHAILSASLPPSINSNYGDQMTDYLSLLGIMANDLTPRQHHDFFCLLLKVEIVFRSEMDPLMSVRKIFERLEGRCIISKDNLINLKMLFAEIGFPISAIRICQYEGKYPPKPLPTNIKIPPVLTGYSILLQKLSKQISDNCLKSLLEILCDQKAIYRAQAERIKCPWDFFLYLEGKLELSPTDLGYLRYLFFRYGAPDLAKLIDQYREK